MKRILIIRNISYPKLLIHLDKINNSIIDIVSTNDIPKLDKINKIIQFPYDTTINIDKAPKEFLYSLESYDEIITFNPDIRLELPKNIIDFIKKYPSKFEIITIIDDNSIHHSYDLKTFTKYMENFKPQVILPKKLSISISDKCNLKCEFCYRKAESEYSMMSIDMFKKLPKELFENATDIELSGYGEILLNRDLFKILDYVSSFNNIQSISFTTNATLMFPNIVEALLRYKKLNLIQISLDTVNTKLYETIRKNSNFSKVIENINDLAFNRYKNPNLSIFMKMVLTNDTCKDLKNMIKYTKKCEFDRLIILPMHISKESMIEKSTFFNKKKTNKLYDSARSYAKRHNVSLSLPKNFNLKIDSNETIHRDYISHPCNEPNEIMYIQANGDVYPCCFSTTSYGNLFKLKLDDIWYGKKYDTLRKIVNTDKCPEDCKVCGMTDNIDNIQFMIKKGNEFREPDIISKVNKYIDSLKK